MPRGVVSKSNTICICAAYAHKMQFKYYGYNSTIKLLLSFVVVYLRPYPLLAFSTKRFTAKRCQRARACVCVFIWSCAHIANRSSIYGCTEMRDLNYFLYSFLCIRLSPPFLPFRCNVNEIFVIVRLCVTHLPRTWIMFQVTITKHGE